MWDGRGKRNLWATHRLQSLFVNIVDFRWFNMASVVLICKMNRLILMRSINLSAVIDRRTSVF